MQSKRTHSFRVEQPVKQAGEWGEEYEFLPALLALAQVNDEVLPVAWCEGADEERTNRNG